MIIAAIEMNVVPEKRRELIQTVHAMNELIRKEKGCLSAGLYTDTEKETRFCLVQEWENQENLDRYLRSDRFAALLGTKGLLCEPLEVKFKVVSHTTGIEAVSTARGRDISVTGRGRSSGTGFE